MRRILLCLSLVASVPLGAAAQNAKPQRPAVGVARSELTSNREVFSNSETLRFITLPQNGTTRTEETTIPIDRPASDTRSSCNGKPVQALAIFYKPNAGYTGADNVVVDVDFHVGGVRRFAYKITVR